MRRQKGKPNKLTRPEEYRAALAASWRASGKYFLMRVMVNTWPSARLGLISSRKAAPRAVDRNRCKRLAREAFRAAQSRLPTLDIVLQQQNDLRNAANAPIRKDLERLLREAAVRFGGEGSGTAKAPDVTVKNNVSFPI